MLLTGHEGEVFGGEFSPDGRSLATGSFDKSINLWQVYGECENYGVLRGHANAVLEVHWNWDGTALLVLRRQECMRLGPGEWQAYEE